MKLKTYEKWWEVNVGAGSYVHEGVEQKAPTLEGFKDWMGDPMERDRVEVRSLFGDFESILDAGCGGCPEYYALQGKEGLKYTGMDITPKIVEFNKSKNIECVQGTLNAIPFPDNSFDLVHSRHVVEHMSGIEDPLKEMIRVSRKRVVLSFFISPAQNWSYQHQISLDNANTSGEVYHNCYSKVLIDRLLDENPKVEDYFWRGLSTINAPKSALVVDVKSL
jgi:ubiquinone/menaquinone biosynthesis C-methylase UbiE